MVERLPCANKIGGSIPTELLFANIYLLMQTQHRIIKVLLWFALKLKIDNEMKSIYSETFIICVFEH